MTSTAFTVMSGSCPALRSGARLILVGDPGQLASIEAGAVLGDIVGTGESAGGGPSESASPGGGAGPEIVVLDRVHRFGYLAHLVRLLAWYERAAQAHADLELDAEVHKIAEP